MKSKSKLFIKRQKQCIHHGEFKKNAMWNKCILNNSYEVNKSILLRSQQRPRLNYVVNRFYMTTALFLDVVLHLNNLNRDSMSTQSTGFLPEKLLTFFVLLNRSTKMIPNVNTQSVFSLKECSEKFNKRYDLISTNNVTISWNFLKIVRGITRSFFHKKVLGSYIVTRDSFFTNNIYFPSVTNIKTFNTLVSFKTTVSFKGLKPNIYPKWTILNALQLRKKFFLDHKCVHNNWYFPPLRNKRLFHYRTSNDKITPLKASIKGTITGKDLPLFKNLIFRKKFIYLLFKFFKKWNISKRYISGFFSKNDRAINRLTSPKKLPKFILNKITYYKQIKSIYDHDFRRASQNFLFQNKYFFKKNNFFTPNAFISPNLSHNVHLLSDPHYNLTYKLLRSKICLLTNITIFPLIFKLIYFFNYTSLFMHVENFSSNLIPSIKDFSKKIVKHIYSARLNYVFRENVTPWVYNTLIKFMEFYSGRKIYVDFYSFMDQAIDPRYVVLYKSWMPRFSYYERRLGHRFFLEEALHILHMGFNYQDSKLISSWLKSMIQRISFWKTRFIFRFIKYLFNNYFQYIFQDLGVKGFKIKLKGKISVAGNSRKRCILYRTGRTSHSEHQLKVVHTMDTIVTFTGVLGFQIWIFY